ncbi:hypothetical protein CBR_g3689 [Chara braunii]|uniref:CCHC-type domain-containing protein n=1 Tax=Chara braunii TaxID=69332 RepID=A0A388KFZ8_CHABU|nr:hypothetical protein CBR_g3689 [Chara braunii]|eukprot:GBG68990.1 hypothetical protein CBR_g3689 [Chara braunii]
MAKEVEALKAAMEKLQNSNQRKKEPPVKASPRPEGREKGDPSPRRTWNYKACMYCGDEDHRKRDCQAMLDALKEGIIELDDKKYVIWADEGKPVPFLPSMKINVDIRKRRMNEAKAKQAEVPLAMKVSRVTFEEEVDNAPESPRIGISSIKFEESMSDSEAFVCTQGVGESSHGKKEDPDQRMRDEQVKSPKSPLMMKKAKVPLLEATATGDPRVEAKTSILTIEKGGKKDAETVEEEGSYFYILGSGKLNATVNGVRTEVIMDDGSESTVCEDKVARKLGLEMDRSVAMTMVSANQFRQPTLGVCHKVSVVVAGVEATVPVFMVEHSSSELILGRT